MGGGEELAELARELEALGVENQQAGVAGAEEIADVENRIAEMLADEAEPPAGGTAPSSGEDGPPSA